MAVTTPQLTIKLSGKNILTEFENAYLFNLQTKKEQTYLLNSTDPVETIDISDIVNIKWMMFLSDTNFELTFTTATETLKITTNVFILSPETTFVTGLTSITIKATSATTKQSIDCRVYGIASTT